MRTNCDLGQEMRFSVMASHPDFIQINDLLQPQFPEGVEEALNATEKDGERPSVKTGKDAPIIGDNFKGLNVDKTKFRSMLKSAFNAMLNSKKALSNPPKGITPGDFGLKWSQISNAII